MGIFLWDIYGINGTYIMDIYIYGYMDIYIYGIIMGCDINVWDNNGLTLQTNMAMEQKPFSWMIYL